MKFTSTGSRVASRLPVPVKAGGREAGFSLLEVLCALTVASLALTVLLQSYTSSLRATRQLGDHFNARLLAQSLLNNEARRADVGVGTLRGTQGKFNWTIRYAPASENWAAPPSGTNWQLFDVELVVTWVPNGQLRLHTMKLGRP